MSRPFFFWTKYLQAYFTGWDTKSTGSVTEGGSTLRRESVREIE